MKHEILTRLALLCGVACLTLTSSAEAVECAYRGVDTDARVVRDSGEMFLPTNWISDMKCERLAITSGSVRIVSRNPDGRIMRRTADSGYLVTGMSNGADGGGSLLHMIGVMLAGDERVRAGRSRSIGASKDSIEAAFPSGFLVMPGGPLVIDVPITADESGAKFVLSRDGAIAFQTELHGPSLTIPSNTLVINGNYQWQLKFGHDIAAGQFTVVAAATYADVLSDIANRNGAGNTTDADVAFKTATSVLAAGYAMEARKLIREALSN